MSIHPNHGNLEMFRNGGLEQADYGGTDFREGFAGGHSHEPKPSDPYAPVGVADAVMALNHALPAERSITRDGGGSRGEQLLGSTCRGPRPGRTRSGASEQSGMPFRRRSALLVPDPIDPDNMPHKYRVPPRLR